MRLMIILAALLAPDVRAQSDPFSELGIPVAAPGVDPASIKKDGKKASGIADMSPLEAALPERLGRDIGDMLAWRSELDSLLSYARRRPQVFPPAPVEKPVQFDEYQVEARAAWGRALDILLALDAAAARYGEAPRLSKREARAAAFAALAVSYAARARFVRAWEAYVVRDASLAGLFNEPAPELGMGAGVWTRFAARFSGARGRREAGLVRAAWKAGGAGNALSLKNFSSKAAAAAFESDLKFLAPESPRRFSLEEATRAGDAEFSLPERGSVLTSSVPERAVPAFMLPVPEGELTVSSRVAFAVDSVRHWFQLGASSAPAVLGGYELRDFARALMPGDILLARRLDGRGSVGQGGWWDAAGLYLGTDAERRATFGDDTLSASLRGVAPVLSALSTMTAQVDLPTVVAAGPGGVAAAPLSRFAAVSALAALRPRVGNPAKKEALLRAARLIGRAYDRSQDPGTEAAISEGELIERAFAGALSFHREASAWAASPNLFAKRFDELFGTAAQIFDFVAGVAPGSETGDRRMTLEAFRVSGRLPKWDFVDRIERAR